MALGIILGVDAGLSEVKIVGQKGEIKFASVLQRKTKQMKGFQGVLSFEAKNKESQFELSIGGKDYYLGDHARFVAANSGEYIAAGSDGSGSKNNRNAFIRAIGGICAYVDHYETYEDRDINVYMTYGTPIENSQSEEEIEAIEDRFLNNGSPIEVVYNGTKLNITIKDILVLPEGAAAYYAKEAYPSEDVYIFDAGSQTLNLTHLHNGTPSPTSSTNTISGVEYYKETYGDEAADVITEQVVSLATSKLKWPAGAHVYICGGFAQRLIEPFIENSEGRFTAETLVPEVPVHGSRKPKELESIFANATGLFYLAMSTFEEYINVVKRKKG